MATPLRPKLRSKLRNKLYNPLQNKFGGFSYNDLFPLGTELGLLWRAADLENQYQDTAGTTPADENNDPVARIDDTSNTLKDLDGIQATPADTPTLNLSSGVWSWNVDGSTDYMESSFVAADLSSDCSVFWSVNTTSLGTSVCVSGNGTTNFLGIFATGSSSTNISGGAGTPTYYVDNVDPGITTRGDMYDEISDGVWHIVEARNCDLSGWNAAGFSNYSSGGGLLVAGNFAHLIIVPSGATLDNLRDSLIAQMQQDLAI